MPETRTRFEGVLRIALGSGSGVSQATASATTPVVLGFVDNFTYTSANTISAVGDRGVPSHNKLISRAPIDISCTIRHTGQIITPSAVSGASVSHYYMELRYSAPEAAGNPSGYYVGFMGVPYDSIQFTEGDLNSIQLKAHALAMTGYNQSGILG